MKSLRLLNKITSDNGSKILGFLVVTDNGSMLALTTDELYASYKCSRFTNFEVAERILLTPDGEKKKPYVASYGVDYPNVDVADLIAKANSSGIYTISEGIRNLL